MSEQLAELEVAAPKSAAPAASATLDGPRSTKDIDVPMEMRALPLPQSGNTRRSASGSSFAESSNLKQSRRAQKRRRIELRTIPPPVPVSGALRDLYAYLNHQDQDDGAVLLKDLGRLTEGMLQQRVREFENLAFRLGLDEDREMKRGLALSILRDQSEGEDHSHQQDREADSKQEEKENSE